MSTNAKFTVFVDRDGTICYDKHYMSNPADIELIPTVAKAIRKLNEAHIPVISRHQPIRNRPMLLH